MKITFLPQSRFILFLLNEFIEVKSFHMYSLGALSDNSQTVHIRCQVREKEVQIKEMKEQITELVGILRHSESRRREMEKQLKQREQTATVATTPPVRFSASCMKTL